MAMAITVLALQGNAQDISLPVPQCGPVLWGWARTGIWGLSCLSFVLSGQKLPLSCFVFDLKEKTPGHGRKMHEMGSGGAAGGADHCLGSQVPVPTLSPTAAPMLDESVIIQLVEMGFPMDACRKAVYYTGNSGVEAAMNWVMSHIDDPGR